MDTGLLVAIIIVVVLLVLVAVLVGQRRRSRGLQERFGPEYRRTVARTGDPSSHSQPDAGPASWSRNRA